MQDKVSRRAESWGTRGSLSSLISAGSWHSLILHWCTGCFPALEELIDEQCCAESQESTSPGWHAADSCQNAVSPWCLANGKNRSLSLSLSSVSTFWVVLWKVKVGERSKEKGRKEQIMENGYLWNGFPSLSSHLMVSISFDRFIFTECQLKLLSTALISAGDWSFLLLL